MNIAHRSMAYHLAAVTLLLFAEPSHAAGDPTRGAKVFQQCAACHSIKSGPA